jgi:hypothetical protein
MWSMGAEENWARACNDELEKYGQAIHMLTQAW